jgi:hypothetical protein
MAIDWRSAYLQQSRSDYETLQLLRQNNVPQCQQLHYLQMLTEKLAKGFQTRPGGPRHPTTHEAFRKFIVVAKGRPELMQVCGFKGHEQYSAYIDSLKSVAKDIEDLAPVGGQDRPNPEYLWEQMIGGKPFIISPVEHSFTNLDFSKNPKMRKMLLFIEKCFQII